MKRIAWIFALLPLLGIGWLLLQRDSKPSPGIDLLPASREANHGKPVVHRAEAKKRYQNPEELAKAIESYKREEESSAKFAKFMTPEIRREFVDAKMRRLSASYSGLFQSWNLDSETVDEVLKIIRERETKLSSVQQKRDEAGRAGAREYLENREIEYTFADIQLANLLGDARFKELSKAEAEEQARVAAWVRAKMSGRPAD